MTPSRAILFDTLFMIRLLVVNWLDVLVVSDVVRRRTSSHLEATTVPGGRGDEPPESVVTSGVAPRVPLAMPNDDAHMWALAGMSSPRAVDRSLPSFRYRDWSVVRLSPRREPARCGPPSTQLLRAARGESPSVDT